MLAYSIHLENDKNKTKKAKEKGRNQDIPVSQMQNYNKVKKQYENNKKILEQTNETYKKVYEELKSDNILRQEDIGFIDNKNTKKEIMKYL